jgi:hypothetical protein
LSISTIEGYFHLFDFAVVVDFILGTQCESLIKAWRFFVEGFDFVGYWGMLLSRLQSLFSMPLVSISSSRLKRPQQDGLHDRRTCSLPANANVAASRLGVPLLHPNLEMLIASMKF